MSLAQIITHLFTVAPTLLPVLADAAAKSVAILAVTAIATIAMRRASAAARHLVWLLGLASVLGLPILSAALPAWHVLPAWAMPTPAESASPRTMPPVAMETPIPQPIGAQSPAPLDEPPNNTAPQPPVIASPAPASPTALPPPPAATPGIHTSWQAWMLLAWAVGGLLLFAHILLGLASLAWLGRRSDRITGADWITLLGDLSAQLGLRREVTLLASRHRTMPMIWGIFRIRLLLPADATDWTGEQRRAVLLHELAHVKRNDCLWQPLTQFIRTLYWFNPLAWLACRRLQTEREMACDDLVLSRGTKPSTYAEQLLAVAADMPAPRLTTAAIAMARPSQLESRLLAILDAGRNRKTVTVASRVVAAIAALLVTSCVAVLFGTNPKPLSATVTFVAEPDGRPLHKPSKPIELNAAEATELASFFPQMGQSNGRAGAWMTGAEIAFRYPNGRSAKVVVSANEDYGHWSEGHGDWAPHGDLAAFLNKLRPRNEGQPQTSPARSTPTGSALNELRDSLLFARLRQIQAQTNYNAALKFKADPQKLREMAGPLITQLDPQGQTLRGQIGDVELQIDLLTKKGYLAKAPMVVQDQALLGELQEQIDREDKVFAKAYLKSLFADKQRADDSVRLNTDALRTGLATLPASRPATQPDSAPASLQPPESAARPAADQPAATGTAAVEPVPDRLQVAAQLESARLALKEAVAERDAAERAWNDSHILRDLARHSAAPKLALSDWIKASDAAHAELSRLASQDHSHDTPDQRKEAEQQLDAERSRVNLFDRKSSELYFELLDNSIAARRANVEALTKKLNGGGLSTPPMTRPASEPATQSADATLTVHLLDASGQPLRHEEVGMQLTSIGYSAMINHPSYWPDAQGTVKIPGLAPGHYRFVMDGWDPEFLDVDVPTGGLTTQVRIIRPKDRHLDLFFPKVEVVHNDQTHGQYLLHVTIGNGSEQPYTLTDDDLALWTGQYVIRLPKDGSYAGDVIPARGKGNLELWLKWSTYQDRGIWWKYNGDIEIKGPMGSAGPGLEYYRVIAGNSLSLPIVLPAPSGAPASPQYHGPGPATAPAPSANAP